MSLGSERHDLTRTLFEPLLPALGDCRRLFIAPDGELSLVPFEALPLEDHGNFVADLYEISYVSTGRDILRFSMSPKPSSQPLVVVNPDYDLGRLGMRGANHKPVDFGFATLKATQAEGERLAELLRARLVCGTAAVKSVVQTHPSPSILVLSTHGYFIPDVLFDGKPDQHTEEYCGFRFRDLPNPMWRAGLAFAGANTFLWSGKLLPEVGTGILTAEEVTGLDMSGTQLAVLSACETGLGTLQAGEGVFGFRRAFVAAGVRTLVMSLWDVDDAATAFVMDRYFSHLIERQMGRLEALRQAQTDLRRLTVSDAVLLPFWRDTLDYYLPAGARPEDKLFGHPYYWAAFIVLGDPSPLPDCIKFQKDTNHTKYNLFPGKTNPGGRLESIFPEDIKQVMRQRRRTAGNEVTVLSPINRTYRS